MSTVHVLHRSCWSLPTTTTLRPVPVGPGRHTCPPAARCSIGPSGQGRGEASQARPPPATSRAGPEKGAMAFLDDAEATTYTMLKQVLQNHCTTQTLCWPHTLVACGALVALVCAQRDETRDALEPAVAHTLTDLKRLTRARRTAPPLAPFPAE